MEQTKYFEPMIQEAVSVGEKTGQLDVLLGCYGYFYDGEIDDILKKSGNAYRTDFTGVFVCRGNRIGTGHLFAYLNLSK